MLRHYLADLAVEWHPLDDPVRFGAEAKWRSLFGSAFRRRPRVRRGAKAEHEYLREPCTHFLIVPFSSGVEGLPVHAIGRTIGAYECRGPLAPLGAFHVAEFFVCPTDFRWTMVHTHEDYGFDGPLFMRKEWAR